MKKLLIGLSIAGLAFLLPSCKEQAVGVDYGEGKKSDTTYIATVEAAQVKNYYIEKFSGVRCVNCPQGATRMEAISEMPANKGRLKIVTIHAASFTQPDYSKGSKQDLSSEQAKQLMDLVYGGDMSKPQASFDRLSLYNGPNPLISSRSEWESILNTAKSTYPTTPVNIHVSSDYNQGTEAYDIKVKLAYTADVTEPQYLSILLIEDSIVDNQIDPLIENYLYRHVYRQMITPINGTPVLDSLPVKVAGRVYETNYSFKLDLSEGNEFRHKNWNLDHVHIIAFVHNATSGTNKRVYHAMEAHLK